MPKRKHNVISRKSHETARRKYLRRLRIDKKEIKDFLKEYFILVGLLIKV
jgi:hypothetical protein